MLPATPFTVKVEDLTITCDYLSIELPHFIPNVSVFTEDAEALVRISGKYTDKDFQKSADITMTIAFSDTNLPISQTLSFVGNFSVVRSELMPVAYVAVRLGEYCYEIIQNYVNDTPIRDKNNKVYPVPIPHLACEFDNAVFDV